MQADTTAADTTFAAVSSDQNTEIAQQVLERIDLVAQKLGVATAHIWEVLTMQAYAVAAQHTLAIAMFSAILGVLYFGRDRFRAWAKRGPQSKNQRARKRLYNWAVFLAIGMLVVACFTAAVRLPYLLLNPEYYALQEAARLLGITQ